jgi:hypothetical protein
MSERNKTHNGRDVDGNFKVKQADVDDLRTDPEGTDYIRDDVRLGGAVEDIGPQAGQRGQHIGELVQDNREDVGRVTGRDPS